MINFRFVRTGHQPPRDRLEHCVLIMRELKQQVEDNPFDKKARDNADELMGGMVPLFLMSLSEYLLDKFETESE